MAPGMETAFRLYRYLDVIAVFWLLILDNSKQRAKIGWMKTMPHLNAAHGRRSFFKKAAGALAPGFWGGETLEALPQDTKTNSKTADARSPELGRRNIASPSPEHQYQFQPVGSADHGHAHDCPEGVSHDRPDHPYRHQPGHLRSEERRVGKECRTRWSTRH